MRAIPLALTLGDPAGIGPEIVVKAWRALREQGPAFMVIGDANLVAAAASPDQHVVQRVTSPAAATEAFGQRLPVFDLPVVARVVAGKPSPDYGPAVIRWIETGAGLALSGAVSGLVTAPIAKAPLYEGGFKFPGHTEFLGELTADARYDGARGPVMMLQSGDLKVTLATVHEPLSAVAGKLSIERIVTVSVITAQALRRDFGVAAPRLALAGLNPHAGEGGSLGREEIEVIEPAVRALRSLGLDVRGPLPADTLFHAEARSRYDGVICMYHDQALIPVKMLDFWGGVNVTLGLPIVRTSPDHGVAFDIAGRGLARADSLIAAIRLAQKIGARRRAA